jgi:hypothetical protein
MGAIAPAGLLSNETANVSFAREDFALPCIADERHGLVVIWWAPPTNRPAASIGKTACCRDQRPKARRGGRRFCALHLSPFDDHRTITIGDLSSTARTAVEHG